MNSSYKIVLLGAFVLLTAVVAYYAFFGGPEEPEIAAGSPEANTGEDTPPPPRETLPREAEPEPEPETTPPERIVTIDPPSDPDIEDVLDPQPPSVTEERFGPIAGLEDPDVPELNEPGTTERFGPTVEGTPGIVEPPPSEPDLEPLSPDPIIEPEPEPEPEAEPVTPPSATPRTYTVKAGDLLSTIAVEIYGEEKAWFDIAQANPSVDPKQLQVGQVLVLPNRDKPDEDADEPRPPAPGQDQTYTVRPGDNLSRIARRFYGDSEKWDLIYARNRKLIGPRADRLKVGMELIIPQPFSGAE